MNGSYLGNFFADRTGRTLHGVAAIVNVSLLPFADQPILAMTAGNHSSKQKVMHNCRLCIPLSNQHALDLIECRLRYYWLMYPKIHGLLDANYANIERITKHFCDLIGVQLSAAPRAKGRADRARR